MSMAPAYLRAAGDRGLPSSTDPLKPAAWELASITFLALFYLLADTALGTDSYAFINTAGPVFLAGILLLGALRMALLDPICLWTGLLWFRIASAVYYGIGTVMHHFFNVETTRQAMAFFVATPEHFFKFNLITTLCIGVVFYVSAALGHLYPARNERFVLRDSDRLLGVGAFVFSIAGYSVRYLIVIPQSIGLYGDWVMPGAIGSIALLAAVGLFLMTLWCQRYSPAHMPLLVCVLILDMGTGVLACNKSEVLKPLLMFVLAVLQHKFTRWRLLAAAAVIVVTFQLLVPMVEYGRYQLGVLYGSINKGTLQQRFEVMATYFAMTEDSMKMNDEFQGSIARIAYVHSSAAAIEFYDRGDPGNSLEHMLAVMVPRFLWAEKPIFNLGAMYNQKVNGTDSSASWMGIFVEAYWNYGWIGIPIFMFPVGVLHFCLGRFAFRTMRDGNWLHFPIVLLGMMMGFRVDGELVVEMYGNLIFVLALLTMLSVIDPLVRRLLQVDALRPTAQRSR